jgi:hypothetical protein
LTDRSSNADLLRSARAEFERTRYISAFTAALLMGRGFIVEKLEETWANERPAAG